MRAVVTHLEIRAPFPLRACEAAEDLPVGMQLDHILAPDIDEYRRVYDLIGSDWYWVNRKQMSDRQLQDIICDPRTEVYYLRFGDRVIGFLELNLRAMPAAEIVFIGLEKTYIGAGLGITLLRTALEKIRAKQAATIRIQTCTLDHPRAILLYQSHGFTPTSRQNVLLRDGRFEVVA